MIDREMVDYALEYAGNGLAVLPLHSIVNDRCSCGNPNCASPGKHPLNSNGVHGATKDEATIRGWWQQWPWANIGIATGKASSLAVVDVDPRNGGMDSLERLHLPVTLTSQTGSGGFHYYFHTNGAYIAKRKLLPGIDLQAEGAYVVAPPSLHLMGGYQWLTTMEPVSFPQELLAAKAGPSVPGSTVIQPDDKTWVADLLARQCPQGERNETLTRLSGYLRNLLPEKVTLGILLQWNRDRCVPPMDDYEVGQNVHHKYIRYEGPEPKEMQLWTARTLLAAEFPPPVWVLEDYLPEGLAVLGGRPKRGKSWMALQIAIAVASGRSVLGKQPAPGFAIYVGLEDGVKRLQKRLRLMRSPATDNLIVLNDMAPLDKGGLAQITTMVETYHPALVVIDTLSRLLGKSRDQDSNADMTDLLHPLQQLALNNNCCILLIDHHRKPGMDIADAIDDIMGSTAKTGVADIIWGLYRKSGESTGTLKITGRDVEETELALTWDGLAFEWRAEGTVEVTAMERRIREVVMFLDECGEAATKALEDNLEISHSTAFAVVKEARARRLIKQRAESGRAGNPRFLYSLTIAGKAEAVALKTVSGDTSDEEE